MRKKLLWLALPIGVLAALGLLCVDGLPFAAKKSEWADSLRAAAAGADRLAVQKTDLEGEKIGPSYEIRGADAIKGLLDLLEIDAARSGFHCMCDGQYRIHVYRADREVATIGYHHGQSLRWHDGKWKGDGLLTAESQKALPLWFKEHGYAALQEDRDATLAEEKRRAEADERFASFFPAQARKSFRRDQRSASDPVEGDSAIGKELAAAVGNPRQLAVAVCQAFGTLHGHEADWTGTAAKERRALAAVHTVGVEDFVAALREIQQDRDALRGAARIYFYEKFEDKLDPKLRTDWTFRLAEIVLDGDSDMNKQMVLSRLAGTKSPAVRDFLREVFRGKLGKEIDRKQAWDDNPGLRAGAAIMLAMQSDESIHDDVKRLLAKTTVKQDVASLEVSLALLGDPSYIKTEHFRLSSGQIGFAGLQAIERFHGRFGMESLVKGGIHHSWGYVRDEALLTFQRITGKKMTAGEIEDWWEVEHEGQRNRPQPVLRLAGNTDQIRGVTFSPDGRSIAAGSNDSTAKIWNAETGVKTHTLRGHRSTVLDVDFHPDGKRLATASLDKTVKVWDLGASKEVYTLTGHAYGADRLRYNHDGTRLISAGADGMRVWDTAAGKSLATFKEHKDHVRAVAFRPDGQRIAIVNADLAVQTVDPVSGKSDRVFEGHTGSVTNIAYSANGKFLVTSAEGEKSSEGNIVQLWDADSGKVIRAFTGHTYPIVGVAFSPDDKFVASTGWDKTVKIWESATGKLLVSFKAHPESINGLAYHPNGKRLATASEDKTIRVWDLEQILRDAKPRQ